MRRRFAKRKRGTTAIQMAQIGALVLALVMLLGFKDMIAKSAGAFLNTFGPSNDLRVTEPVNLVADPVSAKQVDMGDDAQAD